MIGGQEIVFHPLSKTMGTIIKKQYEKYIKKDLLKLEHDTQCRTYTGLLKVMKDVYGFDFNVNEIVTVVEFEVEKVEL